MVAEAAQPSNSPLDGPPASSHAPPVGLSRCLAGGAAQALIAEDSPDGRELGKAEGRFEADALGCLAAEGAECGLGHGESEGPLASPGSPELRPLPAHVREKALCASPTTPLLYGATPGQLAAQEAQAQAMLAFTAAKSIPLPYDCGICIGAPWWTGLLARGRGAARGRGVQGASAASSALAAQRGLLRSASMSSSSLQSLSDPHFMSVACQPCLAVGDLVILCGGIPRTQSYTGSNADADGSPDESIDAEEEAMSMIQDTLARGAFGMGGAPVPSWLDPEWPLPRIEEE